jgi:MerR family mercuric resistance operon transcriptional regulator
MQTYSIGQLAKLAGVPTSTLRYYERIGLLKPDFRTGGNYRGYNPTALNRLRFVRSAQATGLSLEDIEKLLQLAHADKPPCDEVLCLMQRRHAGVQERIRNLKRVEKLLRRALRGCCTGDEPDLCQDVCRLSGSMPTSRIPSQRIAAQIA